MTTRGRVLRMSNLAERGARGIRQARHDVSRDGLRLDLSWMIGIGRGPDALLEALHRQIARLDDAVADGEARAAPFPHFALDDDLVVESAGREKPGAQLHQGHSQNAVSLAHFGGGEARAREQEARAGIENDLKLRVEDDTGR